MYKANDKRTPGSIFCGEAGFNLVELLVTLAIFSIIMSVAFSAYQAQLQTATKEYAAASGEMDLLVARNILVRDLELGGYGLAEDYSAIENPPGIAPTTPALNANPVPPISYVGTNGTPDSLTIKGTSLGMESRSTLGWSYVDSAGAFVTWGDANEDLKTDADEDKRDTVILLEPTSRRLMTLSPAPAVAGKTYWRFRYNGSSAATPLTTIPDNVSFTPPIGTLIYGLNQQGSVATVSNTPSQPYWAVRYYIKADPNPEDKCVDGARRLLRAESLRDQVPASGNAVAPCVLDFQVAFGLDADENGTIEQWDQGGVNLAASGWSSPQVKKRLKQIRAFALVQSGTIDPLYTYPSATVRVGDAVAGRDLTLTDEQRKYRWKLLSVSVTPRNTR